MLTTANIFVVQPVADGGTIRIERTTLANDDMIKIKLVEDGKIVLIITALLDHGRLIKWDRPAIYRRRGRRSRKFLAEFKPGSSE